MQFQDERLVTCVSSIAGSNLLWEETRRWAEERVLFGKPLSKMQNTQFKMVELYTQLSAAKEFVNACVRKRVAGEDATELITMAKLFCGRVSRKVGEKRFQRGEVNHRASAAGDAASASHITRCRWLGSCCRCWKSCDGSCS